MPYSFGTGGTHPYSTVLIRQDRKYSRRSSVIETQREVISFLIFQSMHQIKPAGKV